MHPTATRGPLRVARAFSATAGAVVAAGVAHRWSGGSLPAEVLLPLTAAGLGVAWLLAGRRLTAGQLLGLVVMAQVVVHVSAAHGSAEMGLSMLGSHAAAAVVTTAVLAWGERALWSLARRWVLRPLQLRAVLVPSVHTVAATARQVAIASSIAARVRVRGPPVTS